MISKGDLDGKEGKKFQEEREKDVCGGQTHGLYFVEGVMDSLEAENLRDITAQISPLLAVFISHCPAKRRMKGMSPTVRPPLPPPGSMEVLGGAFCTAHE